MSKRKHTISKLVFCGLAALVCVVSSTFVRRHHTQSHSLQAALVEYDNHSLQEDKHINLPKSAAQKYFTANNDEGHRRTRQFAKWRWLAAGLISNISSKKYAVVDIALPHLSKYVSIFTRPDYYRLLFLYTLF